MTLRKLAALPEREAAAFFAFLEAKQVENQNRKVLSFRANEVEHAALASIAAQDGRKSISEMVRELVRKEAQARGIWPIHTGSTQQIENKPA